ncbi:chemotaxis protein CheW [Gemmatimonadetes bacterium T265]|nr:chemotaxis protein CheW [Gemmatimonadetes bacterium T265]
MCTATTLRARDAARGGKYLTFFVGDEEYGVAVPRVREIIGLRAIMRVPQTPVFVRGAVDLRGTVVPLIDLRERFGMLPADTASGADPRQTARAEALRCVVVVEVASDDAGARTAGPVPMGIVVDRVSEVATLNGDDVEAPPALGVPVRSDFLLGRATDGTRVQLLLDIDRVLAPDEVNASTRATAVYRA